MSTRILRAVAAVLVAAIAAACGGEEEGPSAAEYIAAADRLCLRAQERVEELDDDFQDFEDVKRFATNAARIGDAMLTDLKNLEAPEELEEGVDEFNGEFSNGLRLIRRLGQAAEDEDSTRIEELAEEIEDQDKKVEKVAQSIGYKQCGIPDEDEDEPSNEDAAGGDSGDSGDSGDDASEEPAGDDVADDEAAAEPPVTLDDIQDALEDEGIEFLATDDVASLEEDSDPPPFESAAFETDDGSAIFEILVYESAQEARAAKAGINAAAGCGDEGSQTICAGVGNAILVIEGENTIVQQIGGVFTDTMTAA